jgi:hypothetical protein
MGKIVKLSSAMARVKGIKEWKGLGEGCILGGRKGKVKNDATDKRNEESNNGEIKIEKVYRGKEEMTAVI